MYAIGPMVARKHQVWLAIAVEIGDDYRSALSVNIQQDGRFECSIAVVK
jgi:hypothetical protein